MFINKKKKTQNIINLYIPHPTSPHCPRNYTQNLTLIANLLKFLIGGDFNAHHPTWYTEQESDTRGNHIVAYLEQLYILNNKNSNTRTPLQTNQTQHPQTSLPSPLTSIHIYIGPLKITSTQITNLSS